MTCFCFDHQLLLLLLLLLPPLPLSFKCYLQYAFDYYEKSENENTVSYTLIHIPGVNSTCGGECSSFLHNTGGGDFGIPVISLHFILVTLVCILFIIKLANMCSLHTHTYTCMYLRKCTHLLSVLHYTYLYTVTHIRLAKICVNAFICEYLKVQYFLYSYINYYFYEPEEFSKH